MCAQVVCLISVGGGGAIQHTYAFKNVHVGLQEKYNYQVFMDLCLPQHVPTGTHLLYSVLVCTHTDVCNYTHARVTRAVVQTVVQN